MERLFHKRPQAGALPFLSRGPVAATPPADSPTTRSILARVVEGFGSNPLVARRAMHELFESDATRFRNDAVSILAGSAEGPGYQFLASLLSANNLVLDVFFDPSVAPLDTARAVARRVLKLDSLLDVKVVRRLTAADQSLDPDSSTTRRVLEILDEISDGSRIAAMLHRLSDSPNACIRSKAALLLGRKFRDARRTLEQLGETDGRVRANAVEALWDADGPEFLEIFRRATLDPHQRVAANAWLGLYKARQAEAVEGLFQMLRHEQLAFRISAAWAMGETADPRFLPDVDGLAGQSDLGARERERIGYVLAALKEAEATARGRQKLVVWGQLDGADAKGPDRRVRLSVTQPGGPVVAGLDPLRFVIWENAEPVERYAVLETSPSDPLVVSFLLPRSDLLTPTAAAKALAAAALHHRRNDLWTVARYYDRTPPPNALDAGEAAELIRFSADATVWTTPGSPSITRPACAPDLVAAARAVTGAAALERGTRHVVVVAGFEENQPPLDPAAARLLAAELTKSRTTFHAVLAPRAPLGVVFELQELCRRTNGYVVPNTGVADIPAMLQRIAAGMVDRYEVVWESEHKDSAIKIEILASCGYGLLEFAGAAS
jgi:HEAT repeat protein